MLLLRLQTVSAMIDGNGRGVCACLYMFALQYYWNVVVTLKNIDGDADSTLTFARYAKMPRTSTMNCSQKKDVKLMKKFISEEIMLSFPAPHKLDLSVRSDINESGDNEKGEIIEG